MPLKYLFLCFFVLLPVVNATPIIIMIDPAGDAHHALREIDDVYERGLTLKCAEAVQKKLEKKYFDIRVFLTRFPGESIEPLQNANFANRLSVDCYLTLHFYKETDVKPHLFLYHYLNNPQTDLWQQHDNHLVFVPYDQAHKKNVLMTQEWGKRIINLFEKPPYVQLFDCKELLGIPHKALVGIQAPALCIEASLKTKDDWAVYVEPITHALSLLIDDMIARKYGS